jgi:ATP-dependent 26S proteasome regulatory subunit
MNFEEEFLIALRSKSSFIYLISDEEERVEYILRKLMRDPLQRIVYTWDFINGFNNSTNPGQSRRNPTEALSKLETLLPETPCLLILKDYSRFLQEINICRQLRNLLPILRRQPKSIVILHNKNELPTNLSDVFVVLELPKPTRSEISKEILRLTRLFKKSISEEYFDNLVNASLGLSLEKIRQVFCRALINGNNFNNSTIDFLFQEKQNLINQNGFVEFCQSSISFNEIGGLGSIKKWVNLRKMNFSEKAINYGLPLAKGLLLVGVQGTGKSLIAKALATDWSLPLFRLDLGRLFGGIVGESESRVRKMIKTTESLSPCILWIDEIDKSFQFINQGGDSGTTNRVLTTLLTWLAEKQSSVFVVATANNIEVLKLELIRKGRFDEIFFLDLPTYEERKVIFKVHLKTFRPETWAFYDLNLLSQNTVNFSGAEIRQVIIDAMYFAFSQKRDFTSQDILLQIKNTVPLAKLNSQTIGELQNWARTGRVRSAS